MLAFGLLWGWVLANAKAQARHATAVAPVLPASDVEKLQRATEAMRSNHVEEAIAGFEQVTRDVPTFAEGYLNLGLAYSAAGRNEEAANALQHAIERKAALRGAHLFLAIADYKMNHLDAAAAAIQKETALTAGDAQAWMWQGIICLALDRVPMAVEALSRAATLDPDNVDILYHRGRAALALSRQSYEAMFRIDPNSWRVHQVLAQADVEADRNADAIEQYNLAIRSAPPQSGLYEALGSSLWRDGKFDEAEAAYEAALKVDPADTLTLYKLGCLRVDRGNAKEGKPLLDRVIIADPSLKMAIYYEGRAESALGDDRKAAEDFKKVIAVNIDVDTTRQAWFQLSRVYRKLHQDAAATDAQAEYRKLDQQDKDAMQEKLRQHRLLADRDTSIPTPRDQNTPQTP